jgi:rSAM/selenodomain-associated transferase 1
MNELNKLNENACKIIVFAKAPVAGFAKTRLARVIGDVAAAELATRMLSETVAQAVAAAIGPVEICCAPDTSHAQFAIEQARHDISLTAQGDGDLGARMSRAFDRAFSEYQAVIIIGTDAPSLQAKHLQEAAQALNTHGAVFAPAHDGGYVMVGLSRAMPSLFQGVAWSTSEVMAQTRAKLATLNENCFELPAFFDIDEASDLQHLPAGWLAA